MARVAAAVLLCLCLAPAPAGAAVTEMGSAGTLSPGGSQFWNGPMVGRSGPPAGGLLRPNPPAAGAPQCDLDEYECFAYELTVGAGGARLRVAIDHPHLEDVFGIELRAPDGSVAAVATGSTVDGAPTHSAEVFVADPAPGVWRATAVGHDVSDSAFRMRARLEPASPSAAAGPVRDLLPNLQANPPSRIGFAGCHGSEVAQYGARVCLRFAQGPQNVGEGPLLLAVHDVGEPREDPVPFVTDPFPVHLVSLSGTQYQVVQRSDGSSYEVPAGEFEYHLQHRHYHHSAVGQFELLRVADERAGVLEPAGTGPKQGFCMDDYFIARWTSFDNAPARDLASYVDPRLDCAVPVAGRTQMKLSAGWGDLYPDALEGQYVEFGDNGDGLYVIRVTTMPGRDILECDYDDNVAYAYLRVAGGEVAVLERGLGTSPWDARKVVVHDGRQPAAGDEKTVPGLDVAGGAEPPPCARRPRGTSPGGRPGPAARHGGRFAFRVKLRRGGNLKIRDARRRVVARARIRPRRRVRVTGIALPGRYTWHAGRSRGRFTVRDQGVELPAPSRIRLRVR